MHKYVLQVHYIVGESVNVDIVPLPNGATWESQIFDSSGRGRIVIRDKYGKIFRSLAYRRTERISIERKPKKDKS